AALGGSAMLNNYLDASLDAVMRRTSRRLLARREANPQHVLGFGVALVVCSTIVASYMFNPLTGIIMCLGAFLYSYVYTMLKRRTPHAVYVGSIPGALPAIGGWAAASNNSWVTPLLIFATVFLWQPGHFWSLAYYYKEDYLRARIPVLPAVANTRTVGVGISVFNSALIAPTLLLSYATPIWGLYQPIIIMLDVSYAAYTLRRCLEADPTSYHSLFRASIVYMSIFVFLVAVSAFLDH
ncbi:MAG: protoheme IX farnesyltransferase, partial [Thermoprotei archaeon]